MNTSKMNYLLLIAATLLHHASAEDILCSCSPTQYTFRLNLNGICNPATITQDRNGIEETYCKLYPSPFSPPIASWGEVTHVTYIQFLELNTDMQVINQDSTYSTYLPNGSVVTFTSISNKLDQSSPIEDFPRAVQLKLRGADAEGNLVEFLAAWSYGGPDGNCTVEPLSVGDYIGWLEIVSRVDMKPN